MNLRKDHYWFGQNCLVAHCFSENPRQLSSWTRLVFTRPVRCLSETGGTWPSGAVGWISVPPAWFARESWSYAGVGETSPAPHAPGRRLSLPASLGARAGDGSKSLRVLKSSPPPGYFFRYLSHNSLVVERASIVVLPAAFAGGRSIETEQ